MSAPEFDGTPMSKREVMIAREAYENGIVRGSAGEFTFGKNGGMRGVWDAAQKAYPLPKVSRPRVVADPHGSAHRWTVRDGQIRPSVHWGPTDLDTLEKITPQRVALWADLLARPTEEVSE